MSEIYTTRAFPIAAFLLDKFGKETWFNDIVSYLKVRIPAMEERMQNSFRYVEVDKNNAKVFSYEYSSILKDACATFGSVLDKFVRQSNYIQPSKETYDFWDYWKLLSETFNAKFSKDLRTAFVGVYHPSGYDIILMPFLSTAPKSKTPDWWEAHNKLKHSDIDGRQGGNMENAFNALAAVAFLFSMMDLKSRVTNLFFVSGFCLPDKNTNYLLFS